MTKFEQTIAQIRTGEIKAPKVYTEGGEIDYMNYQISVHLFHLKLLASGLKVRNFRLKDIRDYYGLSGRTANQMIAELSYLQQAYRTKLLLTRKNK